MTFLFTIMLGLFVIGAPIAVALGFSSLLLVFLHGRPLTIIAIKTFEGLNTFSLMAVPFFILAGNLMQGGGLAKRLMDFANVLVGWFRGGVAAATVVGTMFFSTLSGSSAATTAAIGSITIPNMQKRGYPLNFAAATIAASGELGVIIPPSLALIMYGLVANVSIGDLFLGGIIPGILVGLTMIFTIYVVVRLKKLDTGGVFTTKKEWAIEAAKAFKRAFITLLMPVIVLGGIYSGLFTPTEAAVVAVVYGLVIIRFVYKQITIKQLVDIFIESATISGIILLIVGFSTAFGFVITINQVPQQLSSFIISIADDKFVSLMLMNIMLLITGMFMEALAAIVILAPILVPVATQFGVDPVHFGVIMVLNFAVGMITPPMAVNLFVASQIANLRISQLIRPMLIFLFVLVADLVIVTYLPSLSTWIPSLVR